MFYECIIIVELFHANSRKQLCARAYTYQMLLLRSLSEEKVLICIINYTIYASSFQFTWVPYVHVFFINVIFLLLRLQLLERIKYKLISERRPAHALKKNYSNFVPNVSVYMKLQITTV